MRSEPEKKSDVVRRLVRVRDYRPALRIAKEFRLGISKEDRDAMRLAYECGTEEALMDMTGTQLPLVEWSMAVSFLGR